MSTKGYQLIPAAFFLTRCGRAPSFDVLGSFFPAWLVCVALSLTLTAVARWLLLRLRIVIALPVLTYPSLTALFSFGSSEEIVGGLQHIAPGMRAEVYVMSKPDVHFTVVVDSLGFGVTPDADVVGHLGTVLPDVQRSLNWVHLATRYPVRVRVESPPEDLFWVSESAVVVIRGR